MKETKQSVIQLRIQLKQFNSIEEIMAYPLMKERISHYVQELHTQRRLRPEPAPGLHYVRNAVDMMIDSSELSTSFMIAHYADVHNKVSSIPSGKRSVMTHVCSQAIRDVLTSCETIIKQDDKLNVKEQKAKLTIVFIDQEKSEVTVEFKKLKETWSINKLVGDIKTGELFI